MGNELFTLFISLSISGTLVGLLLFILKAFTKNKFLKSWHYYIWLVVIFRLLLPVHLETNVVGRLFQSGPFVSGGSPPSQAEQEADTDIQSGRNNPFKRQPSKPLDTPENSISNEFNSSIHSSIEKTGGILSYAWLIWIFGVILTLVIKIVDYKNFMSYLNSNNKRVTDERLLSVMDDVMMDLKIMKNIPLYENPLIISPMLAGVFHPFIVLPQKGLKQEQMYYVLCHELTHYKRRDLWYKWLFQLTWSIHWFNPLLYFINREINTYCELSCDEKVIRSMKEDERNAYGNMLLDAAQLTISYKNNVLSTTLVENKHNLKERLKNIMNHKKNSNIILAASFLCIAVVILAAAIAGSKAAENPQSGDNIPNNHTQYTSSDSNRYEDQYYPDFSSFMSNTVGRFVSSLASNITSHVANSITNSITNSISNSYFDEDSWSFSQSFDHTNKNGKAYKLYDDDSLIAGEDISDKMSSYRWSGGNYSLDINTMYFNGSYSILVANAKKDSSISLNYSFNCENGRFKIVLVNPDNKVTTLSSENKKASSTVTVPLKKGLNYIKIVGQTAKVTSLSIKMKDINTLDFEYIVNSREEAASITIKEKIKSGKINYKELMEAAPYMDEEDISYCIGELIRRKDYLSADQLAGLMVLSDEDVTMEYIKKALKGGAFLDEKQIVAIIPHVDEEDAAFLMDYAVRNSLPLSQSDFSTLYAYIDPEDLYDYFMKWDEKQLTFPFIVQLAPHMDEYDLEDLLNRYLSQGGTMNYNQINSVISYLDSSCVSSIVNKLVDSGNITQNQGKELIETWGDEWDDGWGYDFWD